MPEVNLRSLTSDEPNTARVRINPLIDPQLMLTGSSQVIYIHHNIPGVLRKGKLRYEQLSRRQHANASKVNAVLGNHNVDKQISDSKGDVSTHEWKALVQVTRVG